MLPENVFLENEYLRVSISSLGAELTSIYHQQFQLEYMWAADPAYWARHSPVLFPIVGALKNNTYYFQEKAYELSRHGFARNKVFEVLASRPDKAVFLLTADDGTKKQYPFDFNFYLYYQLQKNVLSVTYEVENKQLDNPIYFSVGAHPAFAVPLVSGTSYNDYYLMFEQPTQLLRWPITADGLIEKEPVPLQQTQKILLSKELFSKDAMVFKTIPCNRISLLSSQTKHGLEMSFPDFPFLGLWAANHANFVCIEPWCGIADSVDTDQNFIKKEGLQIVAAQEKWIRQWQVTLF
jgi:galactose mutarotase-like enzyme